jgi:DNA invertase Pin-like site-specific DNA recombinase
LEERVNSPGWAIYLRVSDEDKQSPERSFAMQRERIQEHLLEESSFPLFRKYQDTLTGTSPNRKDYQQMLTDAKLGRFSHLGLYRADRFGRNTVEGLQAATKLISWGIKVRVASMPSLRPENPDGFFMFLIQMGLAQREVDVMRQRTRDGAEAKMRDGGWPNRAPEGYLNKEKQIKSGKYDRWVEKDPEYSKGVRKAWDLLLTQRYTLDQICEELTKLGFSRSSGRPWAWNDPKTNRRRRAKSTLHHIFNNPFYAGWVVSERFDIPYGEIRGRWEPIVSSAEYERGVSILQRNGENKSRLKKHFYLLRNLLYVKASNDRTYKMYGSTPRGRTETYSYYITHSKPNGKKLRVHCETVDEQIPLWLAGIRIPSERIPEIKRIYQREILEVKEDDKEIKAEDLQDKIERLKDEEAKMARLLILGKITEKTYDQLRAEWNEKLQHAKINLEELEREARFHLDDLDVALALISQAHILFDRLSPKEQALLLKILTNRFIVNPEGEIIDFSLNAPFVYLRSILNRDQKENTSIRVSEFNQPPIQHEQFDSVERFLASIRFQQRGKVKELGVIPMIDLKNG